MDVVISDIHGNWPALQAVFDDIENRGIEYDRVLCVGDLVGIVPFNNTVIEFIRDMARFTVVGNHDARHRDDFIFTPSNHASNLELEIVSDQVDSGNLAWLNSLPERIGYGDIVMAHSNPFRLWDSKTTQVGFKKGDAGLHKGDYTRIGPYLNERVCYVGHTHYQCHVDCSSFPGQSGDVVNPGSVGQPWDGMAEYALVEPDTDQRSVELCETEYDNSLCEQRAIEYGFSFNDYEKPGRL